MMEIFLGFGWGVLLGLVTGIGLGMYLQYKREREFRKHE